MGCNDPFIILNSIKSAVEILFNSRTESNRNKNLFNENDGTVNEYEVMVRRLEEESRNHIRLEQQLKLKIELLELKVEELERIIEASNNKFQQTIRIEESLKNKDNEVFNKFDFIKFNSLELKRKKNKSKSFKDNKAKQCDILEGSFNKKDKMEDNTKKNILEIKSIMKYINSTTTTHKTKYNSQSSTNKRGSSFDKSISKKDICIQDYKIDLVTKNNELKRISKKGIKDIVSYCEPSKIKNKLKSIFDF